MFARRKTIAELRNLCAGICGLIDVAFITLRNNLVALLETLYT